MVGNKFNFKMVESNSKDYPLLRWDRPNDKEYSIQVPADFAEFVLSASTDLTRLREVEEMAQTIADIVLNPSSVIVPGAYSSLSYHCEKLKKLLSKNKGGSDGE